MSAKLSRLFAACESVAADDVAEAVLADEAELVEADELVDADEEVLDELLVVELLDLAWVEVGAGVHVLDGGGVQVLVGLGFGVHAGLVDVLLG
jgi:hypothetical protein